MAKKESITASAVNDKIKTTLIVAYDANKGELQFGEDLTAIVPHDQGESVVKVGEYIATRDSDGKIKRQIISKDGNER